MPTKVASYLTELGFKQFAQTSDTISYNSETAGEYIVVTSLNRMYRYASGSTEIADGIRVLEAAGGRWISVGGSAMGQEKFQGAFGSDSTTITLNKVINDVNEILYVNVGNTQILSDEYSVAINANNTVITFPQTIPAGTKYEIVIFSGNTQTADAIDYALLPATLYQHIMTVSSNTIALNKNFTLYSKTISSASTLDFTMPTDYTSNYGVLTFELYINMTTAANILWAPTIVWNGGTAPLFNDVKKYLLSFRTFDGGNTWIGNLEMTW